MDKIENAIRQVYSRGKEYGELKALERLTDRKVLDAIKFELEQRLIDRKHYRQKIFVDFEWIDKIPLAEFRQPQLDINGHSINERVEIGDLFIRYNRREVSLIKGKLTTRHWKNSEIVVQAKKTKKESFFVPIDSMKTTGISSTSKELKLLAEWPNFDLYKASNSKVAEETDLTIIKVKTTKPFAFYGGFSNKSKNWKFGKAEYKEACNLSFSELINGLVKGKYGKNKLETKNPDTDWKTMSDYIETLCEKEFAPPKIFGENESKKRTLTTNTELYFLKPLFKLFEFVTRPFRKNKSRKRTTSTELYCCKPLFKLFEFLPRLFRKNKFLVISINQVDYEGLG